MKDYVSIARKIMDQRRSHNAIKALVPPPDQWPEPLLELADEHAIASGNPEASRKEVWLSWEEWQARELNRLFKEQGTTSKRGHITAATVQMAEDIQSRRKSCL